MDSKNEGFLDLSQLDLSKITVIGGVEGLNFIRQAPTQSVLCKMKCNMAPAPGPSTEDESVQTVALGAVYEPDEGKRLLPENAVFGKWTPWGEFRAGIANPGAKAMFVPGKSYYLTITEAPD